MDVKEILTSQSRRTESQMYGADQKQITKYDKNIHFRNMQLEPKTKTWQEMKSYFIPLVPLIIEMTNYLNALFTKSRYQSQVIKEVLSMV